MTSTRFSGILKCSHPIMICARNIFQKRNFSQCLWHSASRQRQTILEHLIHGSKHPNTDKHFSLYSKLSAVSQNISGSEPNDSGDIEAKSTTAPSHKLSKGKILHKRQISVVTNKETEHWSDFSKTLSEEDSFGTLEPDQVDKSVTSKGISTKETHTKKNHNKVTSQDSYAKTGIKSKFLKLKNDPEWNQEFGTMVKDDLDLKEIEQDSKKYSDDEGEEDSFEEPHRRLTVDGGKHTQNWYGRQIEKLAKQGKIYECIEVLETTMLKEDRVMPNQYVFTVLIGALGRVGYTKKAFSIFNKMKKYGLLPEDPTYTALFNACSNSPWPGDGLQRTQHLREQMAVKGHQPNLTTYKAMIKAFGRCGDIQAAFSLVDELNTAKLLIDREVFAMLLQGCISDKQAGLRYAIEIWRRLRKKRNVSSTIYHYNLLLRAIKECQIGDPVLANQLLHPGRNRASVLPSGSPNQLQSKEPTFNKDLNNSPKLDDFNNTSGNSQNKIHTVHPIGESEIVMDPDSISARTSGTEPGVKDPDSASNTGADTDPGSSWWSFKPDPETTTVNTVPSGDEDSSSIMSTSISILEADVPNILNYKGNFGSVVGLDNLDSPQNRLALFGGLPGILRNMQSDKVQPDIRTFTQLLDLIPSTRDSERDLLAAIKVHGVKIDVDLLNLMIRKRNLRKDYKGAKDIVSLMSHLNLSPNIMTYGCLAMGCHTKQDGLQLLKDMENSDFLPSVDICNILIFQSRMNFSYKLAVCQKMEQLNIKPNKAVLSYIEQAVTRAKTFIVRKEKGLSVPGYVTRETFSNDFGQFMKYYKKWLLSMDLDKEQHPWEQFKNPTPSNDEELTELSKSV